MNRLTALADRTAQQLVDRAAGGIRDVARTVLWVGALLLLAVFGLPFAAGLVLGRFLGARSRLGPGPAGDQGPGERLT